MKKPKVLVLATLLLLSWLLVCCGMTGTTDTASQQVVANVSDTAVTTTSSTTITNPDSGAATVAEAAAANAPIHEDETDYVWDSTAETQIALNGDTIAVTSQGVAVNGSIATITAAGTYTLSGAFVAVGSAGMAQAPDTSSSQNSLLLSLNGTLPAGSLIHIQSSSGEDVLTFAPTKQIQAIAFSSAELATGETYEVYYGGSTTGTAVDGLYEGSSYSGGTLYTSVMLSGTVTQVGGGFR